MNNLGETYSYSSFSDDTNTDANWVAGPGLVEGFSCSHPECGGSYPCPGCKRVRKSWKATAEHWERVALVLENAIDWDTSPSSENMHGTHGRMEEALLRLVKTQHMISKGRDDMEVSRRTICRHILHMTDQMLAVIREYHDVRLKIRKKIETQNDAGHPWASTGWLESLLE